MAENKKPDFVVSDRRKFTEEGELRNDVVRERAEERSEARVQVVPEPPPPPDAKAAEQARIPEPPTQAQQTEQHTAYQQSNKKLDQLLSEKTGRAIQDHEMTFERLVASLYMTAMLQLGLMAPEGEQPRADIMGARQTIDTLGILNEKTKGNLTPSEQNMLQSGLFELRMAYLELTNALTRGPQSGAAPSGSPPRK
jgi:uncharacterized protein DUF1844